MHIRNIFKTAVYVMLGAAIFFGGTVLYILSFSGVTFDGARDCAVVFGAAVYPDATPSPALSDRTLAAIDLYEDKKVRCLIFSGAPSAYDAHEVDVMNTLTKDRDVEEEKIIFDYEGSNTLETIKNLDPNLSYVLVSNDFHLARIDLLTRKMGLTQYDLHASKYRNGRYDRENQFIAREVAAFWYYAFALW